MKNLIALLVFLPCFSTQAQEFPDTTVGYHAFAGITYVESVLINEKQASLVFDPENQNLVRYVEKKISAFDTNKVYRVGLGTFVVKVDHLHRPYAKDQNGKMVYKDCGRTIFLISGDLKMFVVLYAGLSGWYETYFYRQPPSTQASHEAYATRTDRPIDCIIPDVDQRSLRSLLSELLEYEERPTPHK